MEELSPDECRTILEASKIGYLGFNREGESYVIPLFFAYDGEDCWFQCHPGLKDEYIEGTETACLTVMHFESEHVWESVQVFGAIEKVTLSDDRSAAKSALMDVPYPPLPGNYSGGLPKRSPEHMFYLKLTPSRIAGKNSGFKDEDEE